MQVSSSDISPLNGDLFDFLGKRPEEVSFGDLFSSQVPQTSSRKSRKRVTFSDLLPGEADEDANVEKPIGAQCFPDQEPEKEPCTQVEQSSWTHGLDLSDDDDPWTCSGSLNSYRSACSGSWTMEDVDVGRLWSGDDESGVTKKRSSSADAPRRLQTKTRLRSFTPAELFDSKLRPENFVLPCHPLSTSGGTAAFFKVALVPKDESSNEPLDKYIGKSLSRAECEVTFYEGLREVAKANSEWAPLAEVTLTCPGVCRLPCWTSDKNGNCRKEMIDLLLLRNFHCGFECLRLCDIKLGEETAIANWQGKSRLGAQSNKFVDKRTNSFGEGLRLEGMDNPPPALRGQLSAVTDEGAKVSLMRKRLLGDKVSQRCLLQRLQSADFLASWLDVSALGQGCESHTHSAAWSALEEMTKVVRIVAKIPWPQTWIGASLALGLEVSEILHEPRVIVKLFDWGRSELYTEAQYSKLRNERKEDCLHYWQQYVGALCRIHWELARIVAHRCCCSTWSVLAFEVNSESLSVVRSLLKSNSSRHVDVLGVGFIKVRSKNHAMSSECDVPLHMRTNSGLKQMTGKLVVRIEKIAKGISGSIVRLTISHAMEMNQKSTGSTAIVVRAVAFRDDDDAQIYLDSRMQSQAPPLPRGRACSQATAPCRIEHDVLIWDSTLEFMSLGDDAVSRQKRLTQLVPECFAQPTSARDIDDVVWPVLLPPPFVSVEEGRAWSRLWSQNLVPWLGNWDACPRAWRGNAVRASKDCMNSRVAADVQETIQRLSSERMSSAATELASVFETNPVWEVSPDCDSFGRALSQLASTLEVNPVPEACNVDLLLRASAAELPSMGTSANSFVLDDVPRFASTPTNSVLPPHLRLSHS